MGVSNEEIVHFRRANGWTQDQLGAMLGISGKAVSKWERGLSKPCEEHQAKLVELFGLHTENRETEISAVNPLWSIVTSFILTVKKELLRIISTAVILASAYCYMMSYISTKSTVILIGLSVGLFCFFTLIRQK